MIDRKDYHVITLKNGKHRTTYRYYCDSCSADRGYHLMDSRKSKQLCKTCSYAVRSQRIIQSNKEPHDGSWIWQYRSSGKRYKKFIATCSSCGKDRGYQCKKDSYRLCGDCSLQKNTGMWSKGHVPWNKGKKLSKEYSIKNSCAQRQIEIKDFDCFTTHKNDKDRSILKKSNLHIECFKKADYTCQVCSTKGVTLNAHHLNNFAQYEDQRFILENLVCLCKQCHKKIHKEYGNSTTRYNFEEYRRKYEYLRKK